MNLECFECGAIIDFALDPIECDGIPVGSHYLKPCAECGETNFIGADFIIDDGMWVVVDAEVLGTIKTDS